MPRDAASLPCPAVWAGGAHRRNLGQLRQGAGVARRAADHGFASLPGLSPVDPTYQTILDRHPDAEVIIPPRSNAVLSDTAEPTQRDRHIEMLARKGRMGWQNAVGYGKRSLVETAFYRSRF